MGKKRTNILKKLLITCVIFFGLFFIFNDIIIPWYVNKGGVIQVPKIIGLEKEIAFRVLDSLGLEPKEGDIRNDDRYPAGYVLNQNPISGSIVKKGRRVYLIISGGEQSVVVPNLRGRSIRDAKFALERNGLKVGSIEYSPSLEFPENTIIDQTILAGTEVKKNSFVSIVISQGKISEKVLVPDIVGKSLKEAEKILGNAGLILGKIIYQPSSILLPNTVVEQYPREGELVDYGEEINIFVTKISEQKSDRIEY